MKKGIIVAISTMIIVSTLFSGCFNLNNTSNKPSDLDGDGVLDNSDAFENDPNEWSDLDGDGIGDNSDAFENDPNEWSDLDGDGIGDNSDAFENDPNEWSDLDGDGVGDNSDKNPYVNLSIELKIKKFKVTGRVDFFRWAQVYFEIYINEKNVETVDNNGRYWKVFLDKEQIVDYAFNYDIPDQTKDRYTNITVVMKDYDFLRLDKDDIIDINRELGKKRCFLKFDNVENYITNEGVTEGSQGKLWYSIVYPEEIDPSTKILSKTYRWTFNDKNWKLSMDIPITTYETYRYSPVNRIPQSVNNDAMRSFVTSDDKVIEDFADKLSSLAKNEGYDSIKTANFILRFVQSNIAYKSDEVSKKEVEYWRFPVETLVDKQGDCEDTSVLFASIMVALGYDTVLLYYILEDDIGHLAVGIHINGITGDYVVYNDDKKYFYCETTTAGINVGELPSDIPSKPDKIVKI